MLDRRHFLSGARRHFADPLPGLGQWRDDILRALSVAHPDLPRKTTRMDITRYGHAMAIPLPDAQGRIGQLPPAFGRIRFAQSDWAGYSVFEEAFALGHLAGGGPA